MFHVHKQYCITGLTAAGCTLKPRPILYCRRMIGQTRCHRHTSTGGVKKKTFRKVSSGVKACLSALRYEISSSSKQSGLFGVFRLTWIGTDG